MITEISFTKEELAEIGTVSEELYQSCMNNAEQIENPYFQKMFKKRAQIWKSIQSKVHYLLTGGKQK